MSLFYTLKRNAKLALRGAWGRALLASAIVFGAAMALSMVQGVLLDIFVPPVDIDLELALRYGFSEFFFEQFAQTAPLEWAILGVFLLVELLLIVPLTLGVTRWHLLLVQERDPALSEIFRYFESLRHFGRAVWLHINTLVRCTLWAALLLALPGGIIGASVGVIQMGEERSGRQLTAIASVGVVLGALMMVLALFLYLAIINRYLPAAYLLCEDDELSVRGAMRQSVQFSKGYRFSLMWYQLSFIGWGLLCLLVLPMLYAVPYYHTAVAMYARYIIERARYAPQGATREFRPEEDGAPYSHNPPEPAAEPVAENPPEEAVWPGPIEDRPVQPAPGSEWAPPEPVVLPEILTDPAPEWPSAPLPTPATIPEPQPIPTPTPVTIPEPQPIPPPGPVIQSGPLPVSDYTPQIPRTGAAAEEEDDPSIWPEPDQPFRDRRN